MALQAWAQDQVIVTNPRLGEVQIAPEIRYGWTIHHCPEGDKGKDCEGLKRFRKVSFPGPSVLAFQCTVPSGPYAVNPPVPAKAKPAVSPEPNEEGPWKIIRRVTTNDQGVEEESYTVDGDTVNVAPGGGSDTLRLAGINTPECGWNWRKGESPLQRCERGEPGATEAFLFVDSLFRNHNGEIWVRNDRLDQPRECRNRDKTTHDDRLRDGYCRIIGDALVANETSPKTNVAQELVRNGLAFPFTFWPESPYHFYEFREAIKEKRGIWGLEEKGVFNYRGPLYFTSYHPQANARWPKAEDEYARLVNISPETVNLGDFLIEDLVTGTLYPLPNLPLPPTYQVRIFTNYDPRWDRPEIQETFVNLNLDRRNNTAFWRGNSGLLLRRRSDNTPITVIADKQYGAKVHAERFPEGFK